MQDAHDSLSIDMAIGRWKSWHIAVAFVKSPNIKPISCCCLTNVCIRGPLCLHALTLILAGINNYIHYIVWHKITYWLPNFNGVTAEVWRWMGNLIPHFIVLAITYPCWDLRWSMLVKQVPAVQVTRRPLLWLPTCCPIIWSSQCTLLKDWVPVDFIYRYPIFKWIAVNWSFCNVPRLQSQ